ncbi:MAG: serine/threonine protein kinase [Oscillatoriales cyanobacterium]|uniref:serine/threonine-protein kinase n=1 Tax=Microcoleus sp. PH2017_05_CCC_O_A TaxID=2798816 RepID=UPI001DA3CF08|nr:serine/threonine-protein kinase [Microcoleus sp. PH2017_05_CCC_O_A]MCC3436554.1 tetratricopeptide repeat protein [Microcoleus sp. PH2017_05_CCC_O_A]TAG07352.1 MAG: serine/threonine protein kinase [Oscillatoriales cyanobacterium]TAG14813.1 MAG: serine/threonine protein kinase [Oscillatoriales cyanobacterium]TAG35285.1 MAG: serine/threonine protein kinase [Oscillatoriales cyanobacterium]
MDGDKCQKSGCTGTIEDGYCDVCGMAAVKTAERLLSSPLPTASNASLSRTNSPTASTPTGSSSASSRSSRRTGSTSRSSRKQLGAGLVSIPELPSTEPEKALLVEAVVPENKRFCSSCNNALSRERGFCPKCGHKYSFVPSLKPGDRVINQYEVKGAIAYGGLGWIYLGFDRSLSRYVVLKGLLNTEDEASAAVAVAERQFLASVKHANIVGIYNFVNHLNEGFIIMEYVGGQTLKEIRKTRGVLPVAEAIAYIHRILGAFAYLHAQGLVYCDFKPDNVMLESNDVKLIDMGGVRRIDDLDGDIYGTVGYSAPEAGEGPTVVSDLFTIARTLAVLVTNISGFSKQHQYKLPSPQEEPLFAHQESLYRFLLKATAYNADDRFQSAEEMADRLLGVLREVVALETNTPHPAASTLFGSDMLALTASSDLEPIGADFRQLPVPTIDSNDPAFNAVLNAQAIADPIQRQVNLEQVVQQYPNSREALLRLADSSIEIRHYPAAETALTQAEQLDAWDWRVRWYRGRLLLARGQAKPAQEQFDRVYSELPGELSPQLALALAAELAGDRKQAIKLYDRVCRTDPSYVSATFGLARCLSATGDRQAAVEALRRVPPTSNLSVRSRVETARMLIDRKHTAPGAKELSLAATTLEALTLEGMERHRLTKQLLETALGSIASKAIQPSAIVLLGHQLQEVELRKGLEKALRAMAHLSTGAEKIRLVDEANRVRPRTWL